jgi:hypothetical protein
MTPGNLQQLANFIWSVADLLHGPEAAVVKGSLTTAEARQADAEEIAELARIEEQLEQKKEKR